MKTKVEAEAKAQLVLEDLKLLKAGEWEPDADSCQDTIDNLMYVIQFLRRVVP